MICIHAAYIQGPVSNNTELLSYLIIQCYRNSLPSKITLPGDMQASFLVQWLHLWPKREGLDATCCK